MIKTIIQGNLTVDPETKHVGENEEKTVCTLTVASNRFGKDKPSILRVEVWGKIAENCAKFLKKGSGVCAMGDLDIDLYEKDGEKRTAVKLVNADIEFTDRIVNRD